MGLLGIPNPSDASSSSIWASTMVMGGSAAAGMPAAAPSAPGYSGPLASVSILGQPFAIYLGMVLLLLFLKFASEHEKTDLDPADIHIGAYNFLGVGVTAALFIVTGKVLTQKYQIPGVTQFFGAI